MKFGLISGGTSTTPAMKAVAIETIPDNSLVYVYNEDNALKARVASNVLNYYANFFIKVGGALGDTLKCIRYIAFPKPEGINVGIVYLGTNGSITNTAPLSGSGLISQPVGFCDGENILIDFAAPAVKLVST